MAGTAFDHKIDGPRQPQIFVSYAEEDTAWVKGHLLPHLGLDTGEVLTHDNLELGRNVLDEYARLVASSDYTLLILSPAFVADLWGQVVAGLAGFLNVQRRGSLIVLDRRKTKLQLQLGALVRLDATDPQSEKTSLERLRTLLGRPPPVIARLPCPYPGLRSFGKQDHHFFFGRKDEAMNLRDQLAQHPFVVVIGASGVGKSSLVFAGLVPLLEDGKSSLSEDGGWTMLHTSPGKAFLSEPTMVIGSTTEQRGPTFQELKIQSPAGKVLLVIDQFEELFSPVDGGERPRETDQAIRFQDGLADLIGRPGLLVVLTVRADYYPELLASRLWGQIKNHQFPLVPLAEDGLRQAISRPAEEVRAFIDTALVERLVSEAAGEPGALPLVQQVLVTLWKDLNALHLGLDHYEEFARRASKGRDGERNGLRAAIAQHADGVYAKLDQRQQDIAQRILLRLIQFGEGRPDTRRRQPVSALRSASDDAIEFLQTLGLLAEERLITISGELPEDKSAATPDDQRLVDLAHEALIVGWPKLQDWLTKQREAEITRRRLDDQVQTWHRLGCGQGGLLDIVELAEAERWLEGPTATDLGFSSSLIELVAASRQRIIDEHARELARTRAISQARAAASALGSGLGYGMTFGIALWLHGDARDGWGAALYGAAWFPLGVAFGLVVSIVMAMPRFRDRPASRALVAVVAGGVVAGGIYAFARRWTALPGDSVGLEQVLAGALTGGLLALGIATPLPDRWRQMLHRPGIDWLDRRGTRLAMVTALGVIGVAGAKWIENLPWHPGLVVLAGLLLGGLTGSGFLLVDAVDGSWPPHFRRPRVGPTMWHWPRRRASAHRTVTRPVRSWLIGLLTVLVLSACGSRDGGADLTERRDEVFHQTAGGSFDPLPGDDSRILEPGDLVNVNDVGEGSVQFRDGFEISIFRNTGLQIEGFAEEMTPIDRVQLTGGTLYATSSGEDMEAERRLQITAGGAVISTLGTEFLVHYNTTLRNPTLVWVIVTDGQLTVAAGGRSATVSAGWQVWIQDGNALSNVYPATRAIADWAYGRRALPLLEVLGGPTLQDAAILNSPPCTFTGTNIPFHAIFRTSDRIWIMNVAGIWERANQLDCPFSVQDLSIRARPDTPGQTPADTPTPMPPLPDTPLPHTPVTPSEPPTEPPTQEPGDIVE